MRNPDVNRESDSGMVSQSPIIGLNLENEAPPCKLRNYINAKNAVDPPAKGLKSFLLEETNQGLQSDVA